MSEKTGNNFCNSCGTALKPGARFCGSCGKPVAVGNSKADAAVSPAAPVSPAPVAQPQYSADGKWWWDGQQWTAVAIVASAPVVSAGVATGSKKKRMSYGKRLLILAPVAIVVALGVLWAMGEFLPAKTSTYRPSIGAGPYYLHYNCGNDAACMSDPQISEATANGNNTGILTDYPDLAKCQRGVAGIPTGAGNGKWWCSTSKNPADTGA